MGLYLVWHVLIKRGNLQTFIERKQCEEKKEKITECMSRREAWKEFFPHSPQKESTSITPWFGTSSLQNSKAIIFCCLSDPVCGTLLWQFYKSNAKVFFTKIGVTEGKMSLIQLRLSVSVRNMRVHAWQSVLTKMWSSQLKWGCRKIDKNGDYLNYFFCRTRWGVD